MKILDVPQSGSVAGVTSSRNRYGQYRRTRAIPVNVDTTYQRDQRNRLSSNAASWRTLTDNQRAGWRDLGSSMLRSDSLGQVSSMTGFQAYCSVNNNNLQAGVAVVPDAPALLTPDAPVIGAIVLTASAFTIAFTPTPTAVGVQVFAYASPQLSPGRYFNRDFRLITVTADEAVSPAAMLANYSARFGAPVEGNRIFVRLRIYQAGFLSDPTDSAADVST